MYNCICEIKNVVGVKSFENDIYFTQDNVLKCNEKSIIENVEGFSFWFLDSGIYYHDNEGNEFLKNDKNKHELEAPLFVKSNFDYKIFSGINFRRESKKWRWTLGLVDLKTYSILKEYSFDNHKVEGVFENIAIASINKNKFLAFGIDSGNVIWELYQVFKKIIDLYDNKLIVAAEDHVLLSIDINTGKTTQKWQELKGFEAGQEYKNVLPEPSDFVLDKEEGKLIGVFSKYYFEIDLQNGKISYEDVQEELKQYNINSFRRMGDNPFTKDHLFVTAHAELEEQPNVDLDCVLALNRDTKKVDWVHIFKDSGLGTNIPQITNTHLYQLDTDGTLHVFEKE